MLHEFREKMDEGFLVKGECLFYSLHSFAQRLLTLIFSIKITRFWLVPHSYITRVHWFTVWEDTAVALKGQLSPRFNVHCSLLRLRFFI